MFSYYLSLATRSFRRNPGITALMVLAIGLGISVCVISLTVYHAMGNNPLWKKNDQVFALTLDTWGADEPYNDEAPELPPTLLTYKDAQAIQRSNIPQRTVVMYVAGGVLSGGEVDRTPQRSATRATTGDFFATFDTPFAYGQGWDKSADINNTPVLVLSHEMNEKLFGGANSIGKPIKWNDRDFRVIGVLKPWRPLPKFYDLNNGSFDAAEDVYLPFSIAVDSQAEVWGNTNCWKTEDTGTFAKKLQSECVWIESWVELPDAATKARMQSFLDTYANDQRKAGRFPRKQNNRLTPVDQWLKDNRVVQNDNRMLVGLAFAFLAVCLLNTIGLLLAKFLNAAPISGIRRALGASRRDLFLQHLTEAGVVAIAGGVVGLVLGALGLAGVRALYASTDGAPSGFELMAQVDLVSIAWTVGLALLATIVAGLYPAWRVGRLAPASYLKSQ
jgi:putative ABC transport system permease protein